MRNLNFRILEFQSCSTRVEFEQYNSLVAQDDDKEIIVEYDYKYNYDLLTINHNFDEENKDSLCLCLGNFDKEGSNFSDNRACSYPNPT